MPALVAVAVGILLGLAMGGSLSNLGTLRLRFELLILPLFLVQGIARGRLFGLVGASRWSLSVWIMSSVLLVCVMLLNWRIPGVALGAAGVLMNIDVVLLNSAMPMVLGASAGPLASISATELARSTGNFYRVAEQGDLLTRIADVMPIVWGRTYLLASPGDVVLMIAVAVVIIHGMSAKGVGYEPSRRRGSEAQPFG